ncbi:unnamed protein product [Cuscuta epithymum]|nr:unnamed protein product [Cuscuta epithymum]
MFLLGL